MDYFHYQRGILHCESIPVSELGRRYGTPLYIYSARTIREHFRKLRSAFRSVRPLICYSVKANSHLAILDLLRREGAGFDVVSGGELFRVLRIGAAPRRIVFSGVGKGDREIRDAIRAGILLCNVESSEELENVDRIAARMGRAIGVALRINPDVDPETHGHIATGRGHSKFGVPLDQVPGLLVRLRNLRAVRLDGLHMHIGSQITTPRPYILALRRLTGIAAECRREGFAVRWIDIGGGFGIFYHSASSAQGGLRRTSGREAPDDVGTEMARALVPLLRKTRCRVILEPGRFIVGNAGILLTRVLYTKRHPRRSFVICDAGMNDLVRPTLYGAYHRIAPVRIELSLKSLVRPVPSGQGRRRRDTLVDVVGPVCENSDFFARRRRLPPVRRGDLLAISSAGAYGASMSSQYNSRPRAAEVLVEGRKAFLITQREGYPDLIRKERLPHR